MNHDDNDDNDDDIRCLSVGRTSKAVGSVDLLQSIRGCCDGRCVQLWTYGWTDGRMDGAMKGRRGRGRGSMPENGSLIRLRINGTQR